MVVLGLRGGGMVWEFIYFSRDLSPWPGQARPKAGWHTRRIHVTLNSDAESPVSGGSAGLVGLSSITINRSLLLLLLPLLSNAYLRPIQQTTYHTYRLTPDKTP